MAPSGVPASSRSFFLGVGGKPQRRLGLNCIQDQYPMLPCKLQLSEVSNAEGAHPRHAPRPLVRSRLVGYCYRALINKIRADLVSNTLRQRGQYSMRAMLLQQ